MYKTRQIFGKSMEEGRESTAPKKVLLFLFRIIRETER